MNFGELIAKGSAVFLKKKLSAMQAVFDTGTAPEKAAFQASMSGDKIPLTQKGTANGVATLGSDGKIPAGQIPDGLSGSGPASLPIANLQDRPLPYVVSHRGDMLIGLQGTIGAYDQCIRNSSQHLELDVRKTSDGAIVVFHDATADATTDGTGTIESKSLAQVLALNLDTGSGLGPAMAATAKIPQLSEVFARYRTENCCFWIEAKTVNIWSYVIAEAAAAGISPGRIVLQHSESSDYAAITAAVALGYHGMALTIDGSDVSGATLAAAGIRYLACDYNSFPAAKYEEMQANGVNVIAYTVSRRTQLETVLRAGGAGVFSNDAQYTEKKLAPATVDSFHLQKFVSGQHGGYLAISDALTPQYRGSFTAPDWWGFPGLDAAYRGCMMGNMCPVTNPTDFSFDFRMVFDAINSTNRWASIFSGTSDAAFLNGGDPLSQGYHLLIRANGSLEIFTIALGGASAQIAVNAGTTAFTLGTEYRFRLTVKGTSITLANVDAAGAVVYSVTVVSSLYRGGYLHLGRNGCAVRWRDLIVASAPATADAFATAAQGQLALTAMQPVNGFVGANYDVAASTNATGSTYKCAVLDLGVLDSTINLDLSFFLTEEKVFGKVLASCGKYKKGEYGVASGMFNGAISAALSSPSSTTGVKLYFGVKDIDASSSSLCLVIVLRAGRFTKSAIVGTEQRPPLTQSNSAKSITLYTDLASAGLFSSDLLAQFGSGW